MIEPSSGTDEGLQGARAFALIACAALLAAPWRGHIDDFDADIYLVVARNLARDHRWFAMRYLPTLHAVFREHPPFGLWPAVTAIRLLGEWALPAVYALMSLGAIAASGRIARKSAGPRAEVATILLLGTCDSIWLYGGRLLLEPPLLLLSTLSAAAALEDRWTRAALFASAAVLVKGPFGLVPLAGVAAARLPNRRGPAAMAAAALPLAAFIALDPGGGWPAGYARNQLLRSATTGWDGSVGSWSFPFMVIARRFWPGLPFALAGLFRARAEPRLRALAIACAVSSTLLTLPARKWGNHVYVVFPLLAALGGAAVAPWLGKLRIGWIAGGCAVAALVFSLSGAGARLLRPPCAFSTALRDALRPLPSQTPVLVVARSWEPAAQLAAERDLVPQLVPALPPATTVRDAVAIDGTPLPPPWTTVARGSGFSLLRAR